MVHPEHGARGDKHSIDGGFSGSPDPDISGRSIGKGVVCGPMDGIIAPKGGIPTPFPAHSGSDDTVGEFGEDDG